jgi:homoserine kinase
VSAAIRVRAPATSANLGPGFDCAAVALDLRNELVVVEGRTGDPSHLGVRAFALLADPSGLDFQWKTPIPRERGLGSSAAIIALGLVGASLARSEPLDPERLLALGAPLEGHSDNLAAALAGGVCLTWDGRIARVADTLPLTPIAVVPKGRVSTSAARTALPRQVSHRAAAFTAGRAVVLGAAIASGEAELFEAALVDQLHEPYRAAKAPILEAVRAELPAGAAGATLSGSGPTVIVWARDDAVPQCARELEERFPNAAVLPLSVSADGAGPVPV